MSVTIKKYYDALDRLINNCPKIVSRGSKINNDVVALEAGQKRGSIKKSREEFWDLIQKINDAKGMIKAPFLKINKKLMKSKIKADKYEELYEESLNRELMMLETINELEKKHYAKGLNVINNVQ